jgi:hypothetical protein
MTIARAPEQAERVIARWVGPVEVGAPLIVTAEEAAVFSRHGELVRVVPAGSYPVPPEFAGEGVAVCFVSTRPVFGAKFAGNVGPFSGSPVRAVFGEYSFRVTSAALLVQALIGAKGDDEALRAYLAKRLLTALGDALAQHTPSPLASAAVVEQAMAELQSLEEYGLTVLGVGSFQTR